MQPNLQLTNLQWKIGLRSSSPFMNARMSHSQWWHVTSKRARHRLLRNNVSIACNHSSFQSLFHIYNKHINQTKFIPKEHTMPVIVNKNNCAQEPKQTRISQLVQNNIWSNCLSRNKINFKLLVKVTYKTVQNLAKKYSSIMP